MGHTPSFAIRSASSMQALQKRWPQGRKTGSSKKSWQTGQVMFSFTVSLSAVRFPSRLLHLFAGLSEYFSQKESRWSICER